jgi:hypothetical protein
MMLCDFNYQEYVFMKTFQNFTDLDLNVTNETVGIEFDQIIVKKTNWIEYVMIFWVWSYFCEEIRQVLSII